MKSNFALQTFFLLLVWLCLQNFNVVNHASEFRGKNNDSGVGTKHTPDYPSDYFFKESYSPFLDLSAYRIKKVVLDAGHGGKDPGCIGASSREKNNTLAIVLKLGALLKEKYPDLEVIYTRDTDVFIELNERAAIANRNNADLFISVHCNAVSTSKIHGMETYVLGQHRAADNLEVAKRENAVIALEDNYLQNYGGYDPNSPEAHIFSSVYQSAYLEQSILFASLVQQHVTLLSERNDKGVKQAGFLVLRETAMPSVLIETGYLTNREEEAYIASEMGQDIMAQGILDAFTVYKQQLEGDAKPSPVVVKNTTKPVPAQRTTASTEPKPVVVKTPAKQGGDTKASKAATPVAAVSSSYRILLLSWPSRLDRKTGQMSLLDEIVEEQKDGKFYYYTGKYNKRPEADKMLQEIKNLGFHTAYVVEIGK
jgi:N-acetylmuramoyl-L-alanine amidase